MGLQPRPRQRMSQVTFCSFGLDKTHYELDLASSLEEAESNETRRFHKHYAHEKYSAKHDLLTIKSYQCIHVQSKIVEQFSYRCANFVYLDLRAVEYLISLTRPKHNLRCACWD